MVPELGMDWLVNVTSERYYAPTTLARFRNLCGLGEINPENIRHQSCDGTAQTICGNATLLQMPKPEAEATQSAATPSPAGGGNR